MKAAKSICALFLFLDLIVFILPGARACTVFCDSQSGTVLAGRNWDMCNDQLNVMWFVPAEKAAHGRVCFGRHSDCEDGMNDQGLFVAVAAAPSSGRFVSTHRSIYSPVALDQLLARCASVEEAINWLKKSPNIRINSWNVNFLGFHYNSGVGGHFLLADKSGDSAVCEWIKGKFKVVRKSGRCQLMTNFLMGNPDLGGYPCPRFAALTQYFEDSGNTTAKASTKALEIASNFGTRYSQVYDLVNGEVHLFFRRRFANPVKINLAAELAKGPREVELKTLFGDPPQAPNGTRAEPVTVPKVTRASDLSAEEVLKKALEARGGATAAMNIRSIHAKGMVDLDPGWVATSPIEFFAMRPELFRIVVDEKSPVGLKLSQYDQGFDGRKGWSGQTGTAPQFLKGKALRERRDDAAFFGWYDAPTNYKSAVCLGEVSFGGRTCYAVNLMTQSRREENHYYDTKSFLLAGVMEFSQTDYGSVLTRTSFDDYRECGGFLLPTRIGWQSDTSSGTIRYSSIELNNVEESALKIPARPVARPDNLRNTLRKGVKPPRRAFPLIFQGCAALGHQTLSASCP